MVADSVVRARVSKEVKEEAAKILAASGLTLSSAYRLLLHQIVATKEMPFHSFVTSEVTRRAIEDARAGRNLRTSTSVEELMRDLREDD